MFNKRNIMKMFNIHNIMKMFNICIIIKMFNKRNIMKMFNIRNKIKCLAYAINKRKIVDRQEMLQYGIIEYIECNKIMKDVKKYKLQ